MKRVNICDIALSIKIKSSELGFSNHRHEKTISHNINRFYDLAKCGVFYDHVMNKHSETSSASTSPAVSTSPATSQQNT